MGCYQDEYGNYYGSGSAVGFHMNWGWKGSNNGYYSMGHFNPGNEEFNFESKITFGIKS